MEKELKRKMMLEILEARTAVSLEDLADKLLALDDMSNETIDLILASNIAKEITSLELKISEAQKVVIDSTAKIAELRNLTKGEI